MEVTLNFRLGVEFSGEKYTEDKAVLQEMTTRLAAAVRDALDDSMAVGALHEALGRFAVIREFQAELAEATPSEPLHETTTTVVTPPTDTQPYLIEEVTTRRDIYNPDYGDDRVCRCGHRYYRHFDGYDDNAPVGCKYCDCFKFKEATSTA